MPPGPEIEWREGTDIVRGIVIALAMSLPFWRAFLLALALLGA